MKRRYYVVHIPTGHTTELLVDTMKHAKEIVRDADFYIWRFPDQFKDYVQFEYTWYRDAMLHDHSRLFVSKEEIFVIKRSEPNAKS